MEDGRLPAGARWLGQALGLRPGPLRRRLDRLVTLLLFGLFVVALVGVPVGAVAWGNAAYEVNARAAAAAAATRHPVEAVVVAEPIAEMVGVHPEVPSTSYRAEVRWAGADGAPRTAMIDVAPHSSVGDRVGLWVDTGERVTTAPPSERQLRASAFGFTFVILLMGEVLCSVLLAGVVAARDACARRAWGREWEIVEPKWTRQEH